jgi:hypothetical protein
MDDKRQFSWWAADGVQPESYTLNEPTREAIIAAAEREWPGETFTIVYATQDGPFQTRPFDELLTERVLEQFAEDNSERFGEDGMDSDLSLDALAAHLNTAFAEFIAEHVDKIPTWSFTEERDKEVING